ncbi:TetR/AcrR family transcriptional regulator [Kutzneria sp. NPDC052558]|uniref:TetR/AcrR family transcriptional regulator n=1 Tax=Kutzneria sp. NPDC052558 TaxID=3364121 RepID=UPI0037C92D55
MADQGQLRSDARGNLERVLAAAAEVFAARGLGATLADIAKHAGVGVGTVYRRFANKDDLIYDVYVDRIHAGEKMAEAASKAADVWAGFVQYFEQSTLELANDRGMRELITGGYTESLGWARGTPPTRLAELLEDNHKTMGVHMIKLVRRAKRAGVLRRDFQASDMMVLSLGVQATIAFGGAESPQLYRRALGFILDGLAQDRDKPSALPAPALTDAELLNMRRR